MDLKEIIKAIRYRWLYVLIIVLCSVAFSFFWTKAQPAVYTANANGIVASQEFSEGSDVTKISQSYTSNSLIKAKLPSYVELGSLRSVAEYAISELNLQTTPQELIKNVSVTNPDDTFFIRVTAQSSTPQGARDLAEVWVRGMQREVNSLETGKPDISGPIFLVAKDAASLPEYPSSPNLKLNLVVGFIGGVLLALASVLLMHFFDRKIRSTEELERLTDVTVIGSIPASNSLAQEREIVVKEEDHDSNFAISEALRALRTNIQFVNVDSPPRAIVVTSPLPGDGKSTLAANLASSMALNGIDTVLIDADLRRPVQSNIFNLPSGAGLTDVLAGRAELADVAHRIEDIENLFVVGSGSIPPNPSEILGSERMRSFVEGLKEETFVIIDAPPLIPVIDAAIISTISDGAVVVTSAGKTTYEVLNKALSTINMVKGKTLGVVLNKVPRRGVGASYYGYQYKSKYSNSVETKKR